MLADEFGADVEAKDINGRTTVFSAAQYGQYEAIRMLVKEFGADASVRDNNGRTLFLHAAAHGHNWLFRTLVDDHTVQTLANAIAI